MPSSEGSFAAQVKLAARASGWIESEVMEWARARIDASRLGSKALGDDTNRFRPDGVDEGGFAHLAWIGRLFRHPVAERRPEDVDREWETKAPEHHGECHVAKWLTDLAGGHQALAVRRGTSRFQNGGRALHKGI